MTHTPYKSIREHIMDTIERGQVAMRPRWHFIVRSMLIGLGVTIASLLLVYFVSFVFFVLHSSGIWFAPAFGARGWYAFARSLPWVLILLILAFIGLTEYLVRRYTFAYRRPLLYSALGIMVLVFVSGAVIARTSLHVQLLESAEHDTLPVAGPLYRMYGHPRLRSVHPGILRELRQNGFLMVNRRNEPLQVIIVPETKLPPQPLLMGDHIVVFGPRHDDTIQAVGVLEIDE